MNGNNIAPLACCSAMVAFEVLLGAPRPPALWGFGGDLKIQKQYDSDFPSGAILFPFTVPLFWFSMRLGHAM